MPPDNPLSSIGSAASQVGSMVLPGLGGLDPRAQQQAQRRAASQAEIQQALDLAQQLQRGSETEGQRITSPWQIVGNMAQALGGRLQMERARQMAEQRAAELAPLLYAPGATGGGGGAPGGGGESVGPVGSAEDVGAINKTASDLQIDPRTLTAVMHYESGLNPGSSSDSGKGYPVRGLIGFDPDNVRRYGEPASTIAGQMPQVGQYLLDRGWMPGVYAPDDLPRLYSIINHGSLDHQGNPVLTARDINGTVGQHVQRIAAGSYGPADRFLSGGAQQGGASGPGGGGGPSMPLALTGPQPGATSGVDAIARALQPQQPAGGPQAGAGASGGSAAPQQGPGGAARGQLPPGAIGMGPYGPIYVDPRSVPRRNTLTPDQFRHAMVLSVGDPDMQKRLIQIVQEQQQPIVMPVTGGSVSIHPQNPWMQTPVWPVDKGNLKTGSGSEYTTFTTTPGGIPQTRLGLPMNIGGSGGPPAAGAAAPAAGPTPGPAQQPPAGAGSPGAPRPPVPAGAPTPSAPLAAAQPSGAAVIPPLPQNPTLDDLERHDAALAAAKAADMERAKLGVTTDPRIVEAQTAAAAAKAQAEEGGKIAAQTAPGPAAQLTNIEATRKGEAEAQAELEKAKAKNQAEWASDFKPAAATLENYQMIRDAIQSAGPNLSAGPIGPFINQAKMLVSQITGKDVPGTTEQQVVEKGGTMLAAHIAKEMTPRPTQFDFKSIMEKANPNIFQTPAGMRYLVDVGIQQTKQTLDLARLAERTPRAQWPDERDKYFAQHPLVSPLTGKEWTKDTATDDATILSKSAGQPQATPWPQPNASQIDALKAHPDKRSEFDAKFGPGAADRAFGPTVPLSK